MTATGLFKALPEPLQNSTNLATLVSIGFHGLVVLGLAFLPKDRAAQNFQLVNLVTLTPQQQRQLPSSTNPEASLPNAGANGMPPLPTDVQSYLPVPSGNFNSTFIPPLLSVPDLPLPPAPPLYVPPDSSFTWNPPPASLPSDRLPSNPSDWLPRRPPGTTPTRSPASSRSQPETPVPLTPPGPVGAVTPETPNNNPSNGTGIQAGNSPQSALGALGTWIAQFPDVVRSGQLAVEKGVVVSYSYPSTACAAKLEGQAAVAALFNADGSLVAATGSAANPQLIRTSGQEILDRAALAAVPTAIAASDRARMRTFEFDFRYSEADCKGTPAPAAKPDTKAAPTPEVSPNPDSAQPAPKPEQAPTESKPPQPERPSAPPPETTTPAKPEPEPPPPPPPAAESKPAPAEPPPAPAEPPAAPAEPAPTEAAPGGT